MTRDIYWYIRYPNNMHFITNSFNLSLFLTIFNLQITNHLSKAQDPDPDPDPPTPLISCDAALHLYQSNYSVLSHSATFSTKWPPSSPKCLWIIVGDENCEVEISCNVNIPNPLHNFYSTNKSCGGSHVRITDGSNGEMRLCGKGKVERLRASEEGLRDLFVVLEVSEDSRENLNFTESEFRKDQDKGQEVTCFAKCGVGKAVKRLGKKLKRKTENECLCGLQRKPVKVEYEADNDAMVIRYRRIIGGVDTIMNEFPWQAALVYKGTRKPFCGGSVISDNLILTAAHCFANENDTADKIEVLLHAHTLDLTVEVNDTVLDRGPDDPVIIQEKDELEGTIRLQVLEWIIHPLFHSNHLDYDIALLRIYPNIKLEDSSIIPICLPKPGVKWDKVLSSLKGKLLTASGWGRSEENATVTTAILQKLEDIPYIPWDQCFEKISKERRYRWSRRMICAGYPGGKDTCNGDSGGALSVKGGYSMQYLQVGIVSWGEGCARNETAGFYSSVGEFMQWVHFWGREKGSKWCLEEKGYNY